MEIKKDKKYKKLGYIILLIVNIIPILLQKYPVISDEIGTIAAAEMVNGNSWKEYICSNEIAYYKYGVLLIYAPIIRFVTDYIWQYRIMLIVNAFIISSIYLVVWNYLETNTSIKQTKDKFIISFCVGTLPSMLLWSKFIWAETILGIIPWCIICIFNNCKAEDKEGKRVFYAAILAVVSVFGYMVHVRGIVYFVAVLITIIIVKCIEKRWVVNPIVFIMISSLLLWGDRVISKTLKISIWGTGVTNNSVNGLLDAYITKMVSFEGVLSLLALFIGWIFAFGISGLGFPLLGGLVLIEDFSKGMKNREKKNVHHYNICVIFLLLLFVGTLMMGMIYFAAGGAYEILYNNGDRVDKLIYARYLSCVLGPCLMYGIIYIYENDLQNQKLIKKLIIYSVILFKLVLMISGNIMNTRKVALGQLICMPLFISSKGDGVAVYKDLPNHLMIAVIIELLVLIGVLFSQQKRNTVIIMTCVFLLTYIYNSKNFIVYLQNYYENGIEKTSALLDKIDDGSKVAIIPMISRGIYPYKYAINKENIKIVNKLDNDDNIIFVFENEGQIELLYDDEECNDFYMITDDEYSGIVIKGTSLKRKMEKAGISIKEVQNDNAYF